MRRVRFEDGGGVDSVADEGEEEVDTREEGDMIGEMTVIIDGKGMVVGVGIIAGMTDVGEIMTIEEAGEIEMIEEVGEIEMTDKIGITIDMIEIMVDGNEMKKMTGERELIT